MELTEVLSFRITKELRKVLEVEARRKKCRLSDLVRWILVEAAEDIEREWDREVVRGVIEIGD